MAAFLLWRTGMFNNDKELQAKFRHILDLLEADDTEEFVENITELYKHNYDNFQLVLFPTPPFKINLHKQRLVDKVDHSIHFEMLVMIETPNLTHKAILTEDFIFLQYNSKQVILLSKSNKNNSITKKRFNQLEAYFFEKIVLSL